MIAAVSLLPLLHASAMLLFPAMMGLSTVLCLRRAPSPFTTVALHEYLVLTRTLERAWLAVAAGWMLLALARGPVVWTFAPLAVVSGASIVLLLLVGAHVWMHAALAPELAQAAARVGGEVTTVAEDGILVARRRKPEGQPAIAAAVPGTTVYLGGAIAAVGLFVVVMLAAGVTESAARFVQCLLLAGLWGSLGTILVDLCEDVWPGFTTVDRLKRTSRYYVQIFEQWKNMGILLAFLIVLVGAPYALSHGYAPAAVVSFPVWVGACLCFATFFNQVLHHNGVVRSRLPLPVYVNEYSVAHPLWAHFFAVIHTVMAAGLLVGLVAVHFAIR